MSTSATMTDREGSAVEARRLAASPGSSEVSGTAQIPPLRKAAIVLVSLEQSLASQLLAQLDRPAVEAVTWEIARLDRIDPAEQAAVLEEFLGLGMRRLCFVFEDLIRLPDQDIRGTYHDEDMATWALALAGAAPPVRAKVFKALDGTAAAALHSVSGGFRAVPSFRRGGRQAEIAERFRRLHDRGAISLPDPSGGRSAGLAVSGRVIASPPCQAGKIIMWGSGHPTSILKRIVAAPAHDPAAVLHGNLAMPSRPCRRRRRIRFRAGSRRTPMATIKTNPPPTSRSVFPGPPGGPRHRASSRTQRIQRHVIPSRAVGGWAPRESRWFWRFAERLHRCP